MLAIMEPAIETNGYVGQLVLSVRLGNGEAFAELYRVFARMVHSTLLSRLDAEEAQEVTQEVFLIAHRRIGELQDPASFGGWIRVIARNLASTRVRTMARRPRQESLGEMAGPDVGNDDELRDHVLRHIQGLPEAYRETLVMRLVDGMSGPEIARATGLTAASVRVNLHRGMELLRPLLQKEGWE